MLKPILATLFCIFSTLVQAQDNTRAILVLDASGSMWGQIDGKAKITIAQEVIGELLQSLPANQELGLTAYGHRTKGDCSDIQTIIAPGPDQRDAIAKAVNAIKPKGKTPMTGAVIAAAESLRYTEEKATVILVSDGIETCHPDPCAAARALEEAGVDFTAHVVGFNITDPKAIAQMQCLADETGGTFLSADNADELAEALVTVAATPEPEPEPVEIIFSATLEINGPDITQGLHWTIRDGLVESATPGGNFTHSLLPGQYNVTVLRLEDEVSVSADFTVEKMNKRVVLVLPKIVVHAELSAPPQSPIGATIDVDWTAEDVNENDYISVAVSGDKAGKYQTYSYVKGASPQAVRLPLEPGDYELRYVRNASGQPDEVIATKVISLTDITAILNAPNDVPAGSEIDVAWEGPNYQNDYISIAAPDEDAHKYETYSYVERDNPAKITAPLIPGVYELRYVANGNPDRVLGTRAITVTENSASLTAPDQAVAGLALEVVWDGPNNKNDYISVATADHESHKYVGYTYTRKGSPLVVTMPIVPGTYELRYIANGNPDEILATKIIEIIAAEVSIDAPIKAIAGSKIEVSWIGPDNKNDYISVAEIGAKSNKYTNYTYTTRGQPAIVKMPLDLGTYELRYVANGNPDTVLESRTIEITAAEVSITAPDTAIAGSIVDVDWLGPNNQNDYVSVAQADEASNKYVNYKYTTNGTPAQVKMPLEPGEYQLRYVANGSPDQVLADQMITIVAAEVVLDAPAQGVVGTEISVSYVGPNNGNDYISLAEIGSDPNKYDNYTYTSRGNPVSLKLPEIPGTYLIRYVANGSPDKVLSRRSIKVVEASAEPAVAAQLEANDNVTAGGQLEVFWVGPDEQGDTIVLSAIGSNDALSEMATSDGNPALLTLPDDAGQYMLHYISGKRGGTIGSRPVTLK